MGTLSLAYAYDLEKAYVADNNHTHYSSINDVPVGIDAVVNHPNIAVTLLFAALTQCVVVSDYVQPPTHSNKRRIVKMRTPDPIQHPQAGL